MPNAIEHRASAFKGGSVTCLARVIDADGDPIVVAHIASATCVVELIDANDEDADVAVAGFEDVDLTVANVVYDELVTDDDRWTVDATGYNFCHTIDTTGEDGSPFLIAGREYRVTYTLGPSTGPVIIVRFRVKVI